MYTYLCFYDIVWGISSANVCPISEKYLLKLFGVVFKKYVIFIWVIFISLFRIDQVSLELLIQFVKLDEL